MASFLFGLWALLAVSIIHASSGAAGRVPGQQLVAVLENDLENIAERPELARRHVGEADSADRRLLGIFGISCALATGDAAAASAFVFDDNAYSTRRCDSHLAWPLVQGDETANGVHRLHVGIGMGSALVHGEHGAAAGSASQRNSYARHSHGYRTVSTGQARVRSRSTRKAKQQTALGIPEHACMRMIRQSATGLVTCRCAQGAHHSPVARLETGYGRLQSARPHTSASRLVTVRRAHVTRRLTASHLATVRRAHITCRPAASRLASVRRAQRARRQSATCLVTRGQLSQGCQQSPSHMHGLVCSSSQLRARGVGRRHVSFDCLPASTASTSSTR